MRRCIGLAAICAAMLLPAAPALGRGAINGNPYGEGCTEDAVTVAVEPIGFNLAPFGELQLRMSPSCETVWGEVYFSTPHPEEVVTILTEQVDRRGIPPLELSPYSQPAEVSPIYGLMLSNEDCISVRAGVSGYYWGTPKHGESSQWTESAAILYGECTPSEAEMPREIIEVPVIEKVPVIEEVPVYVSVPGPETIKEVREVLHLPPEVTVVHSGQGTKAPRPPRRHKRPCSKKHHRGKGKLCLAKHKQRSRPYGISSNKEKS